MGEQATEGTISAEAHKQAFVTQCPSQTAVAPFLPQALDVGIEVFGDGSDLVGDYQQAVAPICDRSEEIHKEAQDGIGGIK